MLVVENGSGINNANSYCDVQFADDYLASIGNTDWSGDQAAKEQALIVACQSLELLYGSRYLSYRLEGNQALLWPRYPFTDRNMNIRHSERIPVELKKAQAEVAVLYMNGVDVFPEGNADGSIVSESASVGAISSTTTYKGAGKPEVATYRGFRKIDLLLRPIIKGKLTNVSLGR